MAMLRLHEQNVVRQVFVSKIKRYRENKIKGESNLCQSPTFDMMNAAARLGVLSTVYKIVDGKIPCPSKGIWSTMIWKKIWQLDDLYWESTKVLYRANELLYKTVSISRYLPWWEIADQCPEFMRICENMAKIVCHSSRLKCDDVRLKGMTASYRTRVNCEMYALEDIRHIVMQCPNVDAIRRKMYKSIYEIDNGLEQKFIEYPEEVFYWLLGKNIDDVSRGNMVKLWKTSGFHINQMYSQYTNNRTGIG